MDTWKKAYISILVAETLAIAGFSTSMPILPLFLQDLGVTDPAALKFWSGSIQSLAAVTLAATSPLWGSLADSYGRRAMLLRAMFGGALAVGVMPFATAPWQLLVLRALQGAVTGTVAAATVLTAGVVPAAKIGFALGMLQTCIAVGNSVGPLIGGLVSDFLGRRAAFAATALMLAAGGVVILLGVGDDSRTPSAAGTRKARLLPDVRAVLRSPPLASLMAIGFALQAAMSIPMPTLPLFIQELTGDPTLVGSATGMVLGAGAAASAVAAAVVGRLSFRLGYARTLYLCVAGGALMTLPQAFAANPLQLALLRVAAMLFLGGALPAVQALLASRAEKGMQGAVFGINTSVSSVGMALGPAIGSGVAALFDYRAVFAAGAAMLAGTVVAMRAGEPRTVKAAK